MPRTTPTPPVQEHSTLLPPLSSVSEPQPSSTTAAEPEPARTVQKRSPRPPRIYGYTFEGDGVWFEYELNDETNLVTEAKTGVRYRLDPRSTVHAALAGTFNGWSPVPMKRTSRSSCLFGVHVPRNVLSQRRHEFKFVLNETLWVEPPTFASNTAAGALGDSTVRNLVLSLEREADD